ncbi:Co2+/Mg2+ efflux protein ApaG [Kordiimonas marina]|uniref:Co2+/Mg2+ efflux protein ApaG n=1 Tax=Kordiimonas marina TaxID=2872312 RepID=UPI001FF573FF|nr:Co2+/Mg2+ efflux protein ApaG [Kordiimonas marina]MCJ9429896.1 Co2+/Mg2+ efflux protein ApaG [Kordiimonas marina]
MTDDDDLIDGVLTFDAVTEGIHVEVQSFYLNEQSRPDAGQYLWAYRIRITNDGDKTAQLLNRHWVITDGHGHVKEVRGPGVIGEKPVLQPGESFVYTSGTPLNTPTGFMRGSYDMVREDGSHFEVEVPAFSLDSPHMTMNIN